MTSLLADVGTYVRGLDGWRRLAFAWVAGLVSALGFAPFGIFPLLLLGYAALVLLIDGAQLRPRPIRASALAGFAFGFGQFLLGLHWIGFAFMVEPGAHAWQIPFVALLFPGGLALFYALACSASAVLWRQGPSRIFLFTALMSIAEWARGHLLTGFPWNIAAYGWGTSLGVLQSAALFGAYGLTLLTILFGASLAEFFQTRPKWIFPSILTALFALLWIGGEMRLAATPTVNVPDVRLRLVQPNIAQADKIDRKLISRNWKETMSLSVRPASPSPTIIIWPEAAPGPFLLTRDAVALDQIAMLTGRKTILMTGALRGERDELGVPHFYNSFYVFGYGGELLATYDKFHLVPFGEYLPLEETLGQLGLSKLTGIPGSFARGDGPHTYDVPGAPAVGPLICYEVLFPGEVVGARRPGWFVNVTDDSWFGPWAGPMQHLLVARVRAIEEGVPIARAANTGISAIIDSLGRITTKLNLSRSGVVDGYLPASIAPTPYSRIRDLWFWLLIAASTLSGWLFTTRK